MWTDYFQSEYGYGFSVVNGVNGKIVGHGGTPASTRGGPGRSRGGRFQCRPP